MNKITKWYAGPLYAVMALALVVGLMMVPAVVPVSGGYTEEAATSLNVTVEATAVVGNAQTIYVSANATGNISNTTNISVRLEVNSTDAWLNVTGQPQKQTIQLVKGENSSFAINATKAGAYMVTAYDLNTTADPLPSGNDTITFSADNATKLRFNVTSATQTVGSNVTLNISALDTWGNVNTSKGRKTFVSVSNNARILGWYNSTDAWEPLEPPVPGKDLNITGGWYKVVINDTVIEDVTATVTDISGTTPMLSGDSIPISFVKGNATKIVVTPTSDIEKVVGTTVNITGQLADDLGNSVALQDAKINFTLNNNLTDPGFVNGTLSRYSAVTNATGMVSAVLTLPTQETGAGLTRNLNVTMVWQGNATVNGTSANITTVNTTISKINMTWNTTAGETDNIEKASDTDFLNLSITLQDKYGNTAEEARVVNYTITSKTPSDMAVMLSKTNGTTNATTGMDTLKVRSLDEGEAVITAESTGLTNGTFTAIFYGDAAKIVATPTTVSSAIVNTPINVTIVAQDTCGTRVEDFSTAQNVTVNVTGSAAVYNVTAHGNSTPWGYNNVTFNMTNGTAQVAINNTKAGTVWVNLTSGTLTPSNTTITFTSNLTGAWLNATNVTANTAVIGSNITVAIELCDQYGNRIDYDLAPVIVTLNQTWANITWTNLSNVSGVGTHEVTGILTGGYAQVKVKSDTTAGVLNVTPKCPAYPGLGTTAANLTFSGGPYKTIKVTTTRDAIVANGTDKAAITAQLYDEYGNPNATATGVVIDLHTTAGTLASYANTTTAGNVTTTLNSTAKGTATVYATTTDPAITGGVSAVNATVEFVGEPYKFTMDVSPTTLATNKNASITVQVVDITSEAVAMNRTFNLTLDGGTPSNYTGQFTNVQNGTWTGTVTSATERNVTVWMNATDGLVAASNVTVTFSTFPGIDLASGWNFISVPKRLASGHDTFGDVLSGIDWSRGYGYNATTGQWVTLTSSTTVEVLDGYWIDSNEQATITLTYLPGGWTVPPTKALTGKAWNAIGFSRTSAMKANATMMSVDASWSTLIGWNATGQSYEDSIIHNVNDGTTNMTPGKGYWVWMTANDTLSAVSA